MADGSLGVWEPFAVAAVQDLMSGAHVMWWLSGGEALDLFVGHATRAHGDIDISLRREDLTEFRELVSSRLELKIAHDGALHDLGDGPLGPDAYGMWARETATGPWRLQVNLEPVDGNEWVYRRDSRVRLPIERVILRRAGLPCVNPAVQLLWKAKRTAAKDEHDFGTVAPLLGREDRRWLAGAISLCHPESTWPARLTALG